MEEDKLKNFIEAGEAHREAITDKADEDALEEMDKIRAVMQEKGFAIEDDDGVPVFNESWNSTYFIGMEWAGLLFRLEEYGNDLVVTYACPVCHAAINIGFATAEYFGMTLVELRRQENDGVITYGGHRCQTESITESLRIRLEKAYDEELTVANRLMQLQDNYKVRADYDANIASIKARQLERLALLDAINHIEL